MDLNDALQLCRRGSYVRDDATMAKDWKVHFVPASDKRNMALQPNDRVGEFYYINPKTGPAHQVRFSDAMKASFQWRVVT